MAGPVNKTNYKAQLEGLAVYKAFPDISPNPFGFCIDPDDPLRVWFWVRTLHLLRAKAFQCQQTFEHRTSMSQIDTSRAGVQMCETRTQVAIAQLLQSHARSC